MKLLTRALKEIDGEHLMMDNIDNVTSFEGNGGQNSSCQSL
jgi:hypothetical protein